MDGLLLARTGAVDGLPMHVPSSFDVPSHPRIGRVYRGLAAEGGLSAFPLVLGEPM